jgi:hypothetical protein
MGQDLAEVREHPSDIDIDTFSYHLMRWRHFKEKVLAYYEGGGKGKFVARSDYHHEAGYSVFTPETPNGEEDWIDKDSDFFKERGPWVDFRSE